MSNTPHIPDHSKDEEHEHVDDVQKSVEFLKKNGKFMVTAAVLVILAALAYTFYANFQGDTKLRASSLLSAAEGPEQLEELITSYPNSESAPLALIRLASGQFKKGEYEKALVSYEKFLSNYGNHELAAHAELGSCYSLEAKGDVAAAATGFASFASQNASHYLANFALFSNARCLELQGKLTEAKSIYDNFLATNGNEDMWGNRATEALKMVERNLRNKK